MNQETKIEISKIINDKPRWRVGFESQNGVGSSEFTNESDAYEYAANVLAIIAARKIDGGIEIETTAIDTLELSSSVNEWEEQIQEFMDYPEYVEIHNNRPVYVNGEYRGRIKDGIFYQEK